MAVAPDRLNCVATDIGDAPELKRFWRQRFVRILIDIPHDVALALASGARTTASQRLQPHKTFAAILPSDGQFVTDLLNIRRSHEHRVMGSHTSRPQAVLSFGTEHSKPLN